MPSVIGQGCVARISAEVWAKVFVECLSDKTFRTTSPRDAPMLLCQVCTLWRKVALETPILWSSFNVVIDCGTSPREELVKLWIERSKNAPLSVRLERVDIGEEIIEGSDDCFQPMGKLLLDNMYRWRDISFFLPDLDEETISMQRLRGAPMLRSLELATLHRRFKGPGADEEFPNWTDPSLGSGHSILWTASPLLESFSISGSVNLEKSIHSLGIPYGRLTRLDIRTEMSTRDVFSVLQETSKTLTYLCLPTLGKPLRLRSKSTVTLPLLVELRLGGVYIVSHDEFDSSAVLDVLDAITSPALETLALSDVSAWEQCIFTSFVKRSGCLIKRLYLMYQAEFWGADDFIECLRLLPSLEYLHAGMEIVTTIHKMEDDKEVCWGSYLVDKKPCALLRRWNKSTKEFYLCPRLQVISVDAAVLGNLEGSGVKAPFATMIQRRWQLPSPGERHLREVRILNQVNDKRLEGYIRAEVVSLQRMEKEGLVFVRDYQLQDCVWEFPKPPL